MTADTLLRCALGVSDRTLSDFRSDGLGAREMERLRAHVVACPACQARLDEFEAMARTLRAQPEPDGHAQLWQNVQASIAAASNLSAQPSARLKPPARTGSQSHAPRFWAALGSIAAVVALSAGFVALFVSRGGWPPAAPRTSTPTTIHEGSLTWRQVTVPRGFPGIYQHGNDTFNSWFAHAQGDGKTGYACQAVKKYVTAPVVWATKDAGAHWSTITPSDPPANVSGCRVVVDTNNANSLIVSFYAVYGLGQIAPFDQWVTYASFDGGATWTKPAGLQSGNFTVVQAFARGKIYALRGTGKTLSDVSVRLYVSGDGMQTWKQIDATLPPTFLTSGGIDGNDRIQFWVNGATDEVILETAAKQLWSTTDDGAHWVKITLANDVFAAPDVTTFVASAPTTSAALTICGIFDPTQLYCTSDVGKTWNEASTPISADDSGANLSLISVGPDGSIYMVNSQGRSNQTMAIYRLPPGATKASDWQRLGAIPTSRPDGAFCDYLCKAFPSGQGMIFWLQPSVSTTDGGTTNQPYYYVATYP